MSDIELVRHVRWVVEDASFDLSLFDVKAKGWAGRRAVGYRLIYQCGETRVCWDHPDSTHFTTDEGEALGSDRTIAYLLVTLFGQLAEVREGERLPQSMLQQAVVKQYGEALVDQAIAAHGGEPPPWDDVPFAEGGGL